MGIKGNLKDMSVADLIQTSCQEKKTARLILRSGKQEASLFLAEGRLIHAVLGEKNGEEVVYQLLGWKEGTFELQPGQKPPRVTIETNWSHILLEGARRLDEIKELISGSNDRKTTEQEERTMGKLDDLLKEMGNEITGYVASTLTGIDGINIAQHTRTRMDPEAASAQMTVLFKLLDEIFVKMGGGELEDSLMTTGNNLVLMRFLPGKAHYLCIITDRKTGNLGNIRLLSKMYTEKLARAMPH